jgi:hypothetical protein
MVVVPKNKLGSFQFTKVKGRKNKYIYHLVIKISQEEFWTQ